MLWLVGPSISVVWIAARVGQSGASVNFLKQYTSKGVIIGIVCVICSLNSIGSCAALAINSTA